VAIVVPVGTVGRGCGQPRWPAIRTMVSIAPNRVGSAITVRRSLGSM
jgi:hypothetical protein